MQRDIPVIYVAFDALALCAPAARRKVEPLLRLRLLNERRARLDALSLPRRPGHGHGSNLLTAATPQELVDDLRRARRSAATRV